ncbi:MAG TPA: hypothetical protein VII06_09585 [Chloroflexota bacterium]|jgi:hypothetical protein
MLILIVGLLVAAVVVFAIAALGTSAGRYSLLGAGLALLALAELLSRAGALGL